MQTASTSIFLPTSLAPGCSISHRGMLWHQLAPNTCQLLTHQSHHGRMARMGALGLQSLTLLPWTHTILSRSSGHSSVAAVSHVVVRGSAAGEPRPLPTPHATMHHGMHVAQPQHPSILVPATPWCRVSAMLPTFNQWIQTKAPPPPASACMLAWGHMGRSAPVGSGASWRALTTQIQPNHDHGPSPSQPNMAVNGASQPGTTNQGAATGSQLHHIESWREDSPVQAQMGGGIYDNGRGSSGGSPDPEEQYDPEYCVNYGRAVRALTQDLPRALRKPLQQDVYDRELCLTTPWGRVRGRGGYMSAHTALIYTCKTVFRFSLIELLQLWQPERGVLRVRCRLVCVPRWRGWGLSGFMHKGGGPLTGAPWMWDVLFTYRFSDKGFILEHKLEVVDPPNPLKALKPTLQDMVARQQARPGFMCSPNPVNQKLTDKRKRRLQEP